MKAKLVSRDGCVLFVDEDTGREVLATTATEAEWLSHFLQQHLTSELVVQLRLAATHANASVLDAASQTKEFILKRS